MGAAFRRFFFLFLLAFGLGGFRPGFFPVLAADVLPGPLAAEVLRVLDGDTIAVRVRIWPGHQVETLVRLKGIDAPELKARCKRERVLAQGARRFLEAHADEGPIWLTDIHLGKYAGRVLARVTMATGADLSAQLMAAGFARAYTGGRRASWCDGASDATGATGVKNARLTP